MPRRPRTRPARALLLERLEARLAPSADFAALAVNQASYDPSAVLVRLAPEVRDPGRLNLLDGATFVSELSLVPGLWEVRLSPGVSVQTALAAYKASPLVLDASPNFRVSLNQVPNDPSFASQWGYHNAGQTGGTPDADIDAAEAWDVSTGSAATVVAVIDTGVDFTHPDLAANMWVNDDTPGDGLDNDGNGFIDDVHGYDFANNDGNPYDDQGHGTHVAGTIGAVTNNGIGVAGVAWNARIMAVKFLDGTGNGTVANAIRALNYAVTNGATISNNSYGGSSAEDSDPLFLEAIRNARAYGHIFVAGAGNSGTNNDATPFYPANFDSDNVISVAATDHNDQMAYFSNYGATTVDLAAPGVDILSTAPGGGYVSNSGTSMASPHVAGVVALVRGMHPDWTYRQVIDQVLNSVDYLPGLDGRVVTAGRLNAARALLDTDGPRVVAHDPAGGVGGVVSAVRLFFNEPVDPATFGLDDIASFTGPGGPVAVTAVTPVAGSFNRKFELTFAPQITRGNYQLVLSPTLTDRAGHAMDQDGDGVFGEAGDGYTASFTLGDQHVIHSTDTPLGLAAFATTTSTLVVTQDLGIADLDVRLNLDAIDVSFVGVTLVSPAGTRIALAPLTGAMVGPAYVNTVFDDEAFTPIGSGQSPFTGSYKPASPLSALDGQSTLGAWKLELLGLFGGNLTNWSLLVVAQPPRVWIDDVAVAEGDAGTSQATFTVRLSNPIDQPVTVAYATGGGTATPGIDYDAAAGTLTFAPGEVTKAVTVTVHGDALDEPDETFLVTLANAANATLADGEAVGTIVNDELSLSIGDASVVEGPNGTANAVFTVTLSSASTHAVTVSFATAPGTAVAGTDYVSASGSLTFAPGETARTITVGVKGDNRFEGNETFLVNVTASGAFVADGQGLGTIVNDDPVPLLNVNDVSVTEGDSGTKNLTFTISLSVPSDDTVTVAYATANGGATAGSDFTATAGTLTFAPGQTGRSVAVVIAGDADLEPTESFLLTLSGAAGALIMDGQAVGTILGDDVRLSVDDVAAAEGDGATFAAVFTVRLSAPAPFDVSVSYATANGTAGAGGDYVAASGTLTFAAGQTERTVTVVGVGDTRDEVDETFFLNLSNAVNAAAADAQGQATVIDDDTEPTLSVADAVVVEGASGTRNLNFVVRLSAPSGKVVTANYATSDWTATAGSDHQARSGSISFGAGATQVTVSVPVSGDLDAEPDESFLLNVWGVANAALGDGEAVGQIQDDDSLVVEDASVVEGDSGTTTAVFVVRLLAPRAWPVTVAYATANGGASAGTDYLAAAGLLTFAPGETEKAVEVTVLGDRLNEADEPILLNLSNATGALLADDQAAATVVNDDAAPTVSITGGAVAEGHTGTRNVTFTLTLSQPSGQHVTVQYATADGTATAGDYQARSGTVTFYPNNTVASVTVPVVGDAAAEGNESFFLNLTSVTNAALATAQAEAVIFDDDPLPVVSVGNATTTEGNAGTKTLGFSVTLSSASTQTVTVQLTTADGTAGAGSDYVAKTELVTFNPGQTSKTVSVPLTGDAVPEASETFFVRLSSPANAVVGDGEGVGTVQNDDSSLRVNDVTLTETDDGMAVAVFTVSLTGPLPADAVRVNYATGNGSAVAGSDYVATSGTLVFEPGQTTQTVEVLVVGDRLNEASETFVLNLSGAVNAAVADGQGQAMVVDNDGVIPSLSVGDAVVTEGDSGTRNLSFVIKLSAPSGRAVTVNYATANGGATAGSDYQARSGTVTFWAGTTTQTISVPVNGDLAAEVDETLWLNLSGAVNATISDGQAEGVIQDDDSLVVEDATVVEGDLGTTTAVFVVRLLAPRAWPVSVAYATANGSASAGTDYLPASGVLTFAPGEIEKAVEVTVLGDRLSEADEAILLNLSGAEGALVADSQGAVSIVNDDDLPALSVSGATVSEGNAGTKTVTFTVRLSVPSGQAVTVQYATIDGTATAAGGDYVAKTGTLTFNPGATQVTVTVTVNGDMVVEGNETFGLGLSGAANATVAAGEAEATVWDDDSLGYGGNGFRAAEVLSDLVFLQRRSRSSR